MQSKQSKCRNYAMIGAVSGLMLTVAGAVWAEPMADGHDKMMMGSEGYGHGKGDGYGKGRHGRQPHNAAAHFLQMASTLKLTDDQTKQLTKLRDDYVEKNATAEEQLKATTSDLTAALYADEVDLSKVNPLLEKIGGLEGPLWRAYAQQLHDIKALLTAEQKKLLKSKWKEGAHGKDEMKRHGNMPKHP